MWNWLKGKKTYLLAAAGIGYNILAAKHLVPAGMDQSHFVSVVNDLLGFAGLAALRNGVSSAK